MTESQNQTLSVDQLIERFRLIASAQYDALWTFQTARYNRLYTQMDDVLNELKSRDGEQRRSLIPLLESDNVQVRLTAATALLVIVPDLARSVLENIRDDGQMPQAADAAGLLRALDNGSFVPT